MLAIYRPYVEGTTVPFEAVPPSAEVFAGRIAKALAGWGAFVAVHDGQIVGYAYGSAHGEREAYRWSVETTVYVAPGRQRAGIGRALVGELLPVLAARGFCNAYAGIALPNAASVGLHLAVGFTAIGTFPRVGYKHGAWRDVAWFHKVLREQPPG